MKNAHEKSKDAFVLSCKSIWCHFETAWDWKGLPRALSIFRNVHFRVKERFMFYICSFPYSGRTLQWYLMSEECKNGKQPYAASRRQSYLDFSSAFKGIRGISNKFLVLSFEILMVSCICLKATWVEHQVSSMLLNQYAVVGQFILVRSTDVIAGVGDVDRRVI